MIRKKRCEGCTELFRPRAQSRNQRYCKKPKCQQDRKNKWQRVKRRTDKDYRGNDAAAREASAAKKPGYSRRYRENNPEYVKRNRQQQQARNKRRPQKTKSLPMIENTDWQVIDLGGKSYILTEYQGGPLPGGNPLGPMGQRGFDAINFDCK